MFNVPDRQPLEMMNSRILNECGVAHKSAIATDGWKDCIATAASHTFNFQMSLGVNSLTTVVKLLPNTPCFQK